jgi:hypothetical protein
MRLAGPEPSLGRHPFRWVLGSSVEQRRPEFGYTSRQLCRDGIQIRIRSAPAVSAGSSNAGHPSNRVGTTRSSTRRQYLHAALKIFSGTRERNPNELRALALLTEVDLNLGDTSAADADAATAVQKARASLGGFTHSAWLGRALEVQAAVLRAQGRTDAARTTFGQALDMLQLTVGEAAPWTQQAEAALASVNP